MLLSLLLSLAVSLSSSLTVPSPDHPLSVFHTFGVIENIPPEKPLDRMLLVGDIMLARDVETKMNRYGSEYPYKHLQPVFRLHKYQVANFEAAIPAEHIPTLPLSLQLSVAHKHLDALYDAGFTHASLANNHSYDFGINTFHHTKQKLNAAQVTPFGDPYLHSSSSFFVVPLEDTLVGVIGLDATLSEIDSEKLAQSFSYLQTQSDFQVVYIHWGNEYQLTHSSEQEKLATELIELGADLIVGHHPHVVQDIDVINGVPVFYSLGNFIFDQYFSTEVETGLILSLSFEPEAQIVLLPVSSEHSPAAPYLMDDRAAAVYLEDIAHRSDVDLTTSIAAGYISFQQLAVSPQIE